ncbi:aspartate aminotransferase family protein [Amycolatopsis panacis]|uniref:Aminotransferase class III-fold pyridoxal phosphate-dependent enzyme n=1 Tax=Amycolatopsis panacis TaxID=2340917 RepID=A0A419I2J7_9PSEU|nr:aminotransferase class III-fold pyridoxal phosphate-dependent enzyme [Amycolatopsis panacis]RJQ84197.1 aminotransferase class III-fold pyridoxal phosphate-dependent enzyme [Amycolatopsis panacis]
MSTDDPLDLVRAAVPLSLAQARRAEAVIPRGVSSGSRRRAVPLFFELAEGAYLTDLDGNRVVDCVNALGPVLLGHRAPEVTDAIARQLARLDIVGAGSTLEVELAERLCRLVPSAEKICFVSTGSEAVQLALRIARATTGRRCVLKLDGHYHGWLDPVLVNNDVEAAEPVEGLVPVRRHGEGLGTSDDVMVALWNDLEALARAFDRHGEDIAALILEPIPAIALADPPDRAYYEQLRALCDRFGALLIFDEVVTGFRLGLGGAQERLGVRPDLSTFAKAVAGGASLAFVAGSEQAMAVVVESRVVHAGTYNASAAPVAAALATTEVLEAVASDLYPRLDELGGRFVAGLESVRGRGVPLVASHVGSIARFAWDHDLAPLPAGASEAGCIALVCELAYVYGAFINPRGSLLFNGATTPEDVDTVVAAIESAWRHAFDTSPPPARRPDAARHGKR